MPSYDLQCTMCGWETEEFLPITRDLETEPLGCKNPDRPKCAGVMTKRYKSPPSVHPYAMPSRRRPDGVAFKEKTAKKDKKWMADKR